MAPRQGAGQGGWVDQSIVWAASRSAELAEVGNDAAGDRQILPTQGGGRSG